jgi:CheY-like chemotaxis protein
MHNPFILQSGISHRSPNPPKPAAARVLVVDDDPNIVRLLASLLGRNGFAVETHTESTQALARLAEAPATFDVLVTDHDMPRMSGSELIDRARAAGFRGKIILHSGSVHDEGSAEKLRRVDAALAKPLGMKALVPTLHRLLAPNVRGCV